MTMVLSFFVLRQNVPSEIEDAVFKEMKPKR